MEIAFKEWLSRVQGHHDSIDDDDVDGAKYFMCMLL